MKKFLKIIGAIAIVVLLVGSHFGTYWRTQGNHYTQAQKQAELDSQKISLLTQENTTLQDNYKKLTNEYGILERRYYYEDRLAPSGKAAKEGLRQVLEGSRWPIKFDDSAIPWHPQYIYEILNALKFISRDAEDMILNDLAGRADHKPLSFKLVEKVNSGVEDRDGAAGYNFSKNEIKIAEETFLNMKRRLALSKIVLHELAHTQIDSLATQASSKTEVDVNEYLRSVGYLKAAGWADWPFSQLAPTDRPTMTGANDNTAWYSPKEDYAESFALFWMLPGYLKMYFPARYDWMNEKFLGSNDPQMEKLGEITPDEMRLQMIGDIAEFILCNAVELTRICLEK